MPEFTLQTVQLDLPAVAGMFGRRLHEAGLPVSAERSLRFAHALSIVRPIARRRLYWTARAVYVSDPAQVKAFDAVFGSVFGGARGAIAAPIADQATVPAPPDERPPSDRERERARAEAERQMRLTSSPATGPQRDHAERREIEVPLAPSHDELLARKRFDALEPPELAQLYRLMARLRVATPRRVTRRARKHRRGERIDLRRTLRGSMRTGGDPIRLRRRRRRVVPRRVVLLCDISGSMEPYARAYLQFLACAAGSGPNAEAFAFATRLTRLTRALASRNPERAIQNAATAAPDWSSGTRIGDALKAFNDRHGRRGMARGAVIVILSDGWERGEPRLVAREMERLARLAYRIVWVNPRVGSDGFVPRAGGMLAALPHCDALLSGHSLEALDEVVEAIGRARSEPDQDAGWGTAADAERADEHEPWPSATPARGSSVAMPSGYGPSRGNTTPGWEAPGDD
ncbi:MAG: VWA domain-containing protein [Solirubrobacterales bacterium]|nr:VWA domain-containing protein [Solirubrobacterales bacterium]